MLVDSLQLSMYHGQFCHFEVDLILWLTNSIAAATTVVLLVMMVVVVVMVMMVMVVVLGGSGAGCGMVGVLSKIANNRASFI